MTKNSKTIQPNQELIEDTLKLLRVSSMDEEERNMWTIFLPSMETKEIEQFKQILEKEVNQLMDIYLEAKNYENTSQQRKK